MIEISPSIRRGARGLRLVTLGAIVLVETLVLVAVWAVIWGRRADLQAIRIEDQGMAPWPTAISLILIGLLIGLALFRLVRMLARVEAGAPFGAARDLRGFALYLFLTILVPVLMPAVAALLAAAGGSPVRVQLSFTLTEMLMLLITGLLFFVARLLDEAQAIADDASQIV